MLFLGALVRSHRTQPVAGAATAFRSGATRVHVAFSPDEEVVRKTPFGLLTDGVVQCVIFVIQYLYVIRRHAAILSRNKSRN